MKKNEVFHFKKFSVFHSVNAQKVSTDSVLLGAWSEIGEGRRILDIGTGCGVLSLMIAQRFPESEIIAIEQEKDFSEEATENFLSSIYNNQIMSIHGNVLDLEESRLFDHLICNPPYFENSLLSENAIRNKARHIDNLKTEDLFRISKQLLNFNGKLSLVVPYRNMNSYLENAHRFGFSLSRECKVKHTPVSDFSLWLAEFSIDKYETKSEILIIKNENDYSSQYESLLRDFLTIF